MSTTNFSNDPGTTPGSRLGSDSGTVGADGAKEHAQQAAGTAADEGKRVAGVAQDEAKRVTSEAKAQVRGLVDEATTQVDEQSKVQKTRLAETVRTFSDDLHTMTAQGDQSGAAAQLVQQLAEQARGLASHLDDREPRELLDDVRSFARRRPGSFILGSLVAGVVVGRLTRGAKAAQDDSPAQLGGAPTGPAPVIPAPSSPTLTGSAPPVYESGTAAPGGLGSPAPASGHPGVQMSESGIAGPAGGRA